MRGVTLPTHEYARVAADYISQLSIHPTKRNQDVMAGAARMTAATRAYSRVVLRLRAQAEKEHQAHARARPANPPLSASARFGSRPPSPTSIFSSSHHGHGPSSNHNRPTTSNGTSTFQSPLFRLKRAPLLRVFVPSPEGDWLSDANVLECEAELKRAGLGHLMRVGDVIWDVAVGDEGNLGRMVWDGSYLIVSSVLLRDLTGAMTILIGLGLHLFNGWRLTKVPPYIGVLSILFPPCYQDGAVF